MTGNVRPREAAHRETGDLAFAAFAHMQGLKIVRAQEWRRGSALEFSFTFDDPRTEECPDGRWDELHIAFVNSESSAFDASVRALKKLCKRNGKS